MLKPVDSGRKLWYNHKIETYIYNFFDVLIESYYIYKTGKVVESVNYDAIIQRAQEIATQRMKSGEPIGPDDTVCVLSSASGRLFTGLNRIERQGGAVHNVHAELEAIRNMQVMGESVIETLLLISITNGMPLLPCFDCMRHILSLHTDNIHCEIMMQDRAVPLSEFSEQLKAQMKAQMPMNLHSVHHVTSVSAPLPPEASNEASLLKNRVNSLLSAVEDDETDEKETETESGKKKLFGFFRKK